MWFRVSALAAADAIGVVRQVSVSRRGLFRDVAPGWTISQGFDGFKHPALRLTGAPATLGTTDRALLPQNVRHSASRPPRGSRRPWIAHQQRSCPALDGNAGSGQKILRRRRPERNRSTDSFRRRQPVAARRWAERKPAAGRVPGGGGWRG